MTFEQEVLKTVNEVLENPNYKIKTKLSKTGDYLVMYKNVEVEKYSVIEIDIELQSLINKVDNLINPKSNNENTMTLTEHYNAIKQGRNSVNGITKPLISNTITCLDGKERKIYIYADGTIEYRGWKNNSTFGRSFYIELEKLQKWITLEMLEEIYNEIPKDTPEIQK